MRAFFLFPVVILSLSCRREPEVPVSTEIEKQGREIFRYDTFGDERFWTDTAELHKALEKIKPLQALGMGVKVDFDKLNILKFLAANPFGTSGTRELLKQNAVVGVQAKFDKSGHISRAGITCAFCHSTVDNAFVKGIGYRLDGWPNRDLEVGKILAMLKPFTPAQKEILKKWPEGTYDPRFNFDGKSTPLTLPPAYGLAAVKNETYTAEGPISYWNAYVAVTQMHAQGNFSDPRLGVNIVNSPDLVTPKLAALRAYQHSIPAPVADGYDRSDAEKGRAVFNANCASCHVNGTGTDNNQGVMHAPSETGMSAAYADRTTQKKYRTTPLRGLARHSPYFHDGSAKSLGAVVDHYVQVRKLSLSSADRKNLIEYLKAL